MTESSPAPNRTDRGIICAAILAWLLAVALYAWHFWFRHFWFWRDLGWGSSGEWGQFGDYIGGVINPIVGLITVVLVVRTLKVTRTEARDTRNELAKQTAKLQLQLEHFERKEKLDEMKKRLDGVLADWNLALEMHTPIDPKNMTLPYADNKMTTKMFLFQPNLITDSTIQHDNVRKKFGESFESLVSLLVELEQYCREYDEESQSRKFTDFYRRRIKTPLAVFRVAGMVGEQKLNNLEITSLM